MKKCVLVSDSFKGSLSSTQICRIAEDVFSRELPRWELTAIPAADGGEGTVDCFLRLPGAEKRTHTVSGPLGGKVSADYALIGSLAVIETASAAGLGLVRGRENPLEASTCGLGELILKALDDGAREILLGLGGSATNDGGCGCAAALGTVFRDKDGESFIPSGGSLSRIEHIDLSKSAALLRDIKITAMCDVSNPLYGEKGAAFIFAPQKGAGPEDVKLLDSGLKKLSRIIEKELGLSVADIPGAGAAGGLGAGCIAFLGGELSPGVDAVLDAVGFDELIRDADLVITGEGKIDSQSLGGKLISGVAARTKKAGLPLIVLAGCIDESAGSAYDAGVTAMFSSNRAGLPFEKLRPRAADDYRQSLLDIMRSVDIFNI